MPDIRTSDQCIALSTAGILFHQPDRRRPGGRRANRRRQRENRAGQQRVPSISPRANGCTSNRNHFRISGIGQRADPQQRRPAEPGVPALGGIIANGNLQKEPRRLGPSAGRRQRRSALAGFTGGRRSARQ